MLGLRPVPEVLQHGVIRASALSFVVDAVAGITIDTDPDAWSLTTDMSVRMLPIPAPEAVEARTEVVRRGRRSVTCTVDVVDEAGTLVASGAVGFARVPRKEDDPPKPNVTPADAAMMFSGLARLEAPLREEAAIEVVDAAAGIVDVEVTPRLKNSAGTLQGAMVALVAESAAEELVQARFDVDAVVTDLDLRYLAQAPSGHIRTRCQLLGDRPDATLRIELLHGEDERLTTLVFARAAVLALP